MREPLAYIKASPFLLARRYLGTKEVRGDQDNPQILAWLQRVAPWASHDEVPWCSAFCYSMCWLLDLPRPSHNPASARSWLNVGYEVKLDDAMPGFDVVVLKRGSLPQPGPEVLDAPGHVGFFAGRNGMVTRTDVLVLGGNQADSVSVANWPVDMVLGVRRVG